MECIHEQLGKAIAAQRSRLRMTQAEAASLAGVHRNTISRIESFTGAEVSLDVYQRVCSAVGLEISIGIRGATHLRSEGNTDGGARAGSLMKARKFIGELAAMTPEKPDHWSTCGQCERVKSDAAELLRTLTT